MASNDKIVGSGLSPIFEGLVLNSTFPLAYSIPHDPAETLIVPPVVDGAVGLVVGDGGGVVGAWVSFTIVCVACVAEFPATSLTSAVIVKDPSFKLLKSVFTVHAPPFTVAVAGTVLVPSEILKVTV